MRKLTASDRSALIRLASSLPKGSEERRAILAGLVKGHPELGIPDSYEVKGGGYTFDFSPVVEADDDWKDRKGDVRLTVSQGGSERVHMVLPKSGFATFAGEMAKAIAFVKREDEFN